MKHGTVCGSGANSKNSSKKPSSLHNGETSEGQIRLDSLNELQQTERLELSTKLDQLLA